MSFSLSVISTDAPACKSHLVGKPVGIITCSMATTGGVRAQAAIRDWFYGCLAEVVPPMEVAIPTVRDKVQGGKLTDEKSLAMASGLVKALAAATSRKEPGGRAANIMFLRS